MPERYCLEVAMVDESRDAGLIEVLAKRLEQQRLPKALALREKVGRGEKLNDFDIQFLEDVLQDARQVGDLIERHPEWQDLAARMMHLYKEITDKALQNEKADNPGAA
jgi:phage-related protein